MTRRVRGKRSATTFVDGTTAATSISCNSDKRRSAVATKETGRTAEREKCLWWRYFCPLAPSRIPTSQSFADPASRATTAGFRGNAMCVVWKTSRQTVEASIPCGSPGLRTDPLRQPDNLRFAHHDHHRPDPSRGQPNPAVVDYRLRPMVTGRHDISGKARNNTGRDARYEITDVTRPPQRP